MAGAYLGYGEPECVMNIGVSGPGVMDSALQRLAQSGGQIDLGTIAEEVRRSTSFRVTRVGGLIGREVAAALGVNFGIVVCRCADPGHRDSRQRDFSLQDHGHRRHRRSGLHRRVGAVDAR